MRKFLKVLIILWVCPACCLAQSDTAIPSLKSVDERSSDLLADQKNTVLQGDSIAQNAFQKQILPVHKALDSSAKTIEKNTETILNQSKKVDSTVLALQSIPKKYIKDVEKKINKYSDRLTKKTEKTLTKLAKWELKIKRILDKASPETSQKLFGNQNMTFSKLLTQLQEGKQVAASIISTYDEYTDKITTSLDYLQSERNKLDSSLLKPLATATNGAKKLGENIANTEAVQTFIRERKKALLKESIKYIGKSKYLKKINKESYYYVETIKNYKEIFSDQSKTEQVVKSTLNKIPAFQKFIAQNGALSSLFGNAGTTNGANTLAGLQTREELQSMISSRMAMGGANARQVVAENMKEAQSQLAQLKDKATNLGNTGSDVTLPDFKPNNQKSKTFLQRLEYSTNFQFVKNTAVQPGMADIALTVGYKLNDKSIAGMGAAYKLGFGNLEHLSLSHEGIGLRSFVDWKLKKQVFACGGFEMNYFSSFRDIKILRSVNAWQQSALVGVSKKYKISKAVKGEAKLLFDFLHAQHIPRSQAIIFRLGYTL